MPANEGCANYPLIFSELKKANFNGPVILMPFYHEEDYEAMDICLPNHLHCEYTVKAAEAGKHILIEKPMANTVEDCETMIAAAEANEANFALLYENMCASPFVGDSEEKRALFKEALQIIL